MSVSHISQLVARSDFPAEQADLVEIKKQLGRIPRGVVGIAYRSEYGVPLVVATAPRLPDGTPFPTVFYVTHPEVTAAVSRLEANGLMAKMSERLVHDEELAAQYRTAHQAYLAARSVIGEQANTGEVAEIAEISAGGMPTRVKCLHVLAGHSLAEGVGVNPLGDETLEAIKQWCDVTKIDWTADDE